MKSDLFNIIIDSKYIIFGLWMLLSISLAYFALQYENKTSLDFVPPPNSASYNAQQKVDQIFPVLPGSEQMVVMISNNDYTGDILYCENFRESLQKFTDLILEASSSNKYFLSEQNYYTAPILAKSQFCKQKSMIIDLSFNRSWDGKVEVTALKKKFTEIQQKTFPDQQISVLSMSGLYVDLAEGTMQDVLKLDTISIIFGLIIVALFIKQINLLIISLLNLAHTVVISFGISYFIACALDVATFSAAVQTAAAVALTFDYSLFLFSKVKSEVQLGKNAREVIQQMLDSSGHVVLVSGTCLALVFLLLVICGVELVQSIGLCSFVTITLVQLISITNTAAMLAMFPRFFLGEAHDFWSSDYLNRKRTRENKQIGQLQKETNCYHRNCTIKRIQPKESKIEKVIKTGFQKFVGKKWVPFAGLFLVLVISLSFLYPTAKMQHSIDLSMVLPRKSKTLAQMGEFTAQYGAGMLAPYFVVFNKTGANSLLDQEAFDLFGEMAEEFIKRSEKELNNTGLTLNKSQVIAPFFFEQKLSVNAFKIMNKTSSFAFMLKQVSPNISDMSIFAMMLTPEIPLTAKGSDKFAIFFRSVIDDYRDRIEQLGISVNEYARNNAMFDAVELLFASFPMVMGVTAGVIFVILAVCFKSFIAPLRLLFEVVLIYIFFNGINVLIFQFGHANGDDAMFWATIFIMFSICIGLACDYDIFSFNGIYRHYYDNISKCRKAGIKLDFVDCVLAGGDNLLVVMTAGLIMIVSFSGLLLSSLDMLLQFGSCLVIDLAFDTFVVVPIVVPAFSYIFGEANMYPGNRMGGWFGKKQADEEHVVLIDDVPQEESSRKDENQLKE